MNSQAPKKSQWKMRELTAEELLLCAREAAALEHELRPDDHSMQSDELCSMLCEMAALYAAAVCKEERLPCHDSARKVLQTVSAGTLAAFFTSYERQYLRAADKEELDIEEGVNDRFEEEVAAWGY